MIQLRPYQSEAISAFRDAFAKRHRAVLFVLQEQPTNVSIAANRHTAVVIAFFITLSPFR